MRTKLLLPLMSEEVVLGGFNKGSFFLLGTSCCVWLDVGGFECLLFDSLLDNIDLCRLCPSATFYLSFIHFSIVVVRAPSLKFRSNTRKRTPELLRSAAAPDKKKKQACIKATAFGILSTKFPSLCTSLAILKIFC